MIATTTANTIASSQTRQEGGRRLKGAKQESLPGKLLVTIITATFNAADHLLRTLESIRAQDYDNIEWIVVDGASSDETVDLIKQHEDLVAYWISERDKGIADAWNKGLLLASGDAVLILNAGDTYTTNAISVFAHNFEPGKIVCASARVMSETGVMQGTFRARPWKLPHGMHVPHNWCLVPRSIYQELGGYPEIEHSMDFAWFYEFYRRFGNDGFIILPETLGEYTLGGVSDKHYAKGFICNAGIMISAGRSPIIANFFCWVYIFKHWLFKKMQQT